jgi:hypothetical protein
MHTQAALLRHVGVRALQGWVWIHSHASPSAKAGPPRGGGRRHIRTLKHERENLSHYFAVMRLFAVAQILNQGAQQCVTSINELLVCGGAVVEQAWLRKNVRCEHIVGNRAQRCV